MRHIFYPATLIFLMISCLSFSQGENPTGNNKNAKDNYSLGNLKGALDEYLKLTQTDSENVTYNYRIGICYLYTNIDKSKAIYYLEKAAYNPKVEMDVWYELGHAYMVNYKFDKAVSYFEKYKQLTNGKENFEISSERMIQMCNEAKKQIKNPVNVTIENLGPEINSAYPDYNPYVPSDESFIVFTSKRVANAATQMDFDGYSTADIYLSNQKYEKWSKAKGIGNTINSAMVEESVGLSPDGSNFFVYVDNYTAMSTVMLSEKKGKGFQKPEFIGSLSTFSKLITSATISTDKKTLVFASDKNEEAGGLDLYISHKLPSGEWGPPDNIGDVINTVYDEDFPYFAPDGKTLYFCSQGHNSMGGYDLFKTTYDKNTNTFTKPVNLGYPINTPDDDLTISFSASGRHAYISSLRPGGYGDLDIYKVIFNDSDPAYTILTGTIVTKDSINIFKVPEKIKKDSSQIINADIKGLKNINSELKTVKDSVADTTSIKKEIFKKVNIDITITDKNTLKPYGKYLPNKVNGKFLIVLPPGDYEMLVKADGYENYSENIKVFDRSLNGEIAKDIVLSPLIKEQTSN